MGVGRVELALNLGLNVCMCVHNCHLPSTDGNTKGFIGKKDGRHQRRSCSDAAKVNAMQKMKLDLQGCVL